MIEEYTIISIDESRKEKKEALREHLSSYKEVFLDFVDGRNPEQLQKARDKWKIKQTVPMQAGQLGIIYSVLNVLEYSANTGNIMYLEDDAVVVADNLRQRLDEYIFDEYPSEADFINIGLPHEQRSRYSDRRHATKYQHLCRSYNTYNNVCMIWTQHGAERALHCIERLGIHDQIDHMIYKLSETGFLTSYCLRPTIDLVTIVAGEPTLVHDTEWIDNAR